ncbi:MAG: SRPBCC family protein [Stenotrophobium sp.]
MAAYDPVVATLTLTRQYPHPREKVFRAWTDAQALKRWFLPSAEHRVVLAEADARVGGRYRIVVQGPDGEQHGVSGVYREIAEPARLVFTWTFQSKPAAESLVTIELREHARGTELVLTHERLPDEASRARHEHGWTGCLQHLGSVGLAA